MPPELREAHSRPGQTGVTEVDFEVASAKRELRRQLRERRRGVPSGARQRHDAARTDLLVSMIPREAVVALYLSRGDEPRTTDVAAVLWRRGQRVLAPKLADGLGGMRMPPTWAWYRGPSDVRSGYRGIPEPSGPGLPGSVLREADVVVVAALAGGRDGTRLGQGAGWFDRALDHARPDAEVWVLVDEDEVRDTVPSAPWDAFVDRIITEAGVIRVGAP
ncbi:5-formyltetrahydrofolate cyclo-ligase [Propionibacteriaceae bacterium G1746]|uniref:5-formyltetrahydrofolate cyclo-ligase n=1 Tax=Aestuariimicrobium sp. G57 TaxID=3418485 RepID=UPI003C2542E4